MNQKIGFLTVELEERKKEKKQYEAMNEKLFQNLQNQETPSKYKLELESHRHQETLKLSQLE